MTAYTIKALDKVVNEGDKGLTAIRFQITRDDASQTEILHTRLSSAGTDKFDGLQFGTDGHGLGTHSADGSISSDFKFEKGELTREITVYVRGDEILETNEIIRLTLTGSHDAATNSAGPTLNESAVAVVMNDDNVQSRGATEAHATAVNADGRVDAEEAQVIRPMTAAEAKAKALTDALKELEEATKDGKLTQDEIDALHKAYDGYSAFMKKLLDGKIQKELDRLKSETSDEGDLKLGNLSSGPDGSGKENDGGASFWVEDDEAAFNDAVAALIGANDNPVGTGSMEFFDDLGAAGTHGGGHEAGFVHDAAFVEQFVANGFDQETQSGEFDWII